MIRRSRILLLIPHLGGGGAEHVTKLLAENLSEEKYELHLGLITQNGAGIEVLPARVVVHALGARRVRAGAFRLLRLVWRLRPDVILSGMAHLNFLILMLRPFLPPGTCVLIRQNGTVSSSLTSGELPIWTPLLYRILYGNADRIICQSRAMAKDLCDEIGISPRKLVVLPNPVDVEAIRALAASSRNRWTGPGPHLLAVLTLGPKGIRSAVESGGHAQASIPRCRFDDCRFRAGGGCAQSALSSVADRCGRSFSRSCCKPRCVFCRRFAIRSFLAPRRPSPTPYRGRRGFAACSSSGFGRHGGSFERSTRCLPGTCGLGRSARRVNDRGT